MTRPARAARTAAASREDELQHLYLLFQDLRGLGLCGCGYPESAYALVAGVLALAPLYEDTGGVPNWRKALELCGGSDGAFHIVLSAINRARLLEHGGTIGGSWLTARGRLYLQLMRRHKWDDFAGDMTAGLPHDGRDCPADCPVELLTTEAPS